MGSHFTDQRSNLDLCPDNCHHRMDEYKKNFQQTEPLVCQPAFTGNHCTRELSYDCGNLFYLSAIPFAILMILLSLFICHSKLREVNIFLFSGIIVITGTTLLIYTILHLKKQWYGTEE